MEISKGQAVALNALAPGNQNVKLGDVLKSLGSAQSLFPIIVNYEVVSDLSGSLDAIQCPCDLEILDVIVQGRAFTGTGHVTLRKGIAAITNPIPMASGDTIERPSTIYADKGSLSKGDWINVMTNNATDRGLITILARRI